jgi:hypothetical protein
MPCAIRDKVKTESSFSFLKLRVKKLRKFTSKQISHAMKKICFFVNLMLMLSIAANAQQLKDSIAPKPKPVFNFLSTPLRLLPSDYYYCNLGFFCKKEIQFEKATKIPLRLRLGSVDYCDMLEGKKF